MACGNSDSDLGGTTTLCDLPAELLLEILQHLDNPALLNLGLTCRCMQSPALRTFFANNKISDPVAGWLVAYKTPVETLPALRGALFIQKIDELHYYFNPGVERMIGEVQDLRALISRMPSIGLVKLHFSVVDSHCLRGERQVLNPTVWKKEFQGLLDVVLKKGCYELYVQGGEKLIQLYSGNAVKFLEPKAAKVRLQDVIESSHNTTRVRQRRALTLRPLMEFVNRFFDRGSQKVELENPDETQEVVHSLIVPVLNLALTKVSIHSAMLLRDPFFKSSIAMLNSGASTIGTLSFKIADLSPRSWKKLLDAITLPKLFDFEITSALIVPLHGVRFADVYSFLGRHPNIEIVHLYGVSMEVPKRRPLNIAILPKLRKITAHPLCLIWILNGISKKAFPTLSDISISSEYCGWPDVFDYTLFDDALNHLASFPRNFNMMLRFASPNGMNNWIGKHLVAKEDSPKASAISRLDNVTSLVVSSFWFINYDSTTIAALPDWLGMFPNVRRIEFRDQPQENVVCLLEKEFVRNVAMACPKVNLLEVERHSLSLDAMRRDFMDLEVHEERRKGGSA